MENGGRISWKNADLALYWFPVCHFRCKEFNPLVIWIWNQNIAISTIVGTSSRIKTQNDNKIKVSCSANQQNNGLNSLHRKWHTGNQYRAKSAENRMRSNLELLPVMNVKKLLLHVKHDHQHRRNFKSLNIIWCIVCFFCIYWDAWFFFSRKADIFIV
jgi:hypothetical protein